VELLERGDERGGVEGFVFGGEGCASADFFEDVVDVGEAEAVLGLGALAVGIEFLGEDADFGLLLFGAVGEGEGIEAAGFVVAWAVFEGRPPAASA
jgi:hypothetical protein